MCYARLRWLVMACGCLSGCAALPRGPLLTAPTMPATPQQPCLHCCGDNECAHTRLVLPAAALLAAGVCPIAFGTDGGGSGRIPPALCGVVGMKGTHGRIGGTGERGRAPAEAATLTLTLRQCFWQPAGLAAAAACAAGFIAQIPALGRRALLSQAGIGTGWWQPAMCYPCPHAPPPPHTLLLCRCVPERGQHGHRDAHGRQRGRPGAHVRSHLQHRWEGGGVRARGAC